MWGRAGLVSACLGLLACHGPLIPPRAPPPVSTQLPCPEALAAAEAAPPDGLFGTTVARVCVLGVSLESRASAERSLQVQEGEPLEPTRVREDLALLYGLGRFDDVAAYGQATAGGLLLLYVVRERPRLREIVFAGDDRGVAAKLVANSLSPDAPLDIRRVHAITRLVREEHVNQGYGECRVEHAALALPTGDVRLRITVDAGPLWRVAAVNFRGQGKAMEAEAAAQDARRKKREEDRIAAIEAEHVAAEIAAGRMPTAPTAPAEEPPAEEEEASEAAGDAAGAAEADEGEPAS